MPHQRASVTVVGVCEDGNQVGVEVAGLGEELVVGGVVGVDGEGPDDACGEVVVVVAEVEAELLHGGAGAGAAAEEEDLGRAFESFGDGLVEAFEFGLSMAVGVVLVVVERAAEAVGIVGGDGFRRGAVEFGSKDAGLAVIDDDEEVWAVGRRKIGAGSKWLDGLSFHEGFSF
jgi:hypothetical protein